MEYKISDTKDLEQRYLELIAEEEEDELNMKESALSTLMMYNDILNNSIQEKNYDVARNICIQLANILINFPIGNDIRLIHNIIFNCNILLETTEDIEIHLSVMKIICNLIQSNPISIQELMQTEIYSKIFQAIYCDIETLRINAQLILTLTFKICTFEQQIFFINQFPYHLLYERILHEEFYKFSIGWLKLISKMKETNLEYLFPIFDIFANLMTIDDLVIKSDAFWILLNLITLHPEEIICKFQPEVIDSIVTQYMQLAQAEYEYDNLIFSILKFLLENRIITEINPDVLIRYSFSDNKSQTHALYALSSYVPCNSEIINFMFEDEQIKLILNAMCSSSIQVRGSACDLAIQLIRNSNSLQINRLLYSELFPPLINNISDIYESNDLQMNAKIMQTLIYLIQHCQTSSDGHVFGIIMEQFNFELIEDEDEDDLLQYRNQIIELIQ